MHINEATAGAVAQYITRRAPKFALLIDAPWGAGKTHFIKTLTKAKTSTDLHYVTLNGVDTPDAFRHALIKSMPTATFAEAAETLGNALGKLANLNNAGSLARAKMDDQMLRALPRVLIFDDIERCTLDPAVLLGLLNDFVEHQDKNVILLANMDQHPDTEQFRGRSEKVVGKTVRLMADGPAALPVFVADIPEGAGKDWMTSYTAVVLRIFDESACHNLRILRQVVHDCAAVLDQFDPDLLEAKHAVERFVMTYLALAIALVGNEITREDVRRRDDFELFRPDENEKAHALSKIEQRHKNSEIWARGWEVALPLATGVGLFVDGFVRSDDLNVQLRLTEHFKVVETTPLWENAIKWRCLDHARLVSLVTDMEIYIFNSGHIVPAHFLQISCSLFQLAKFGATSHSEDKLLETLLDRIKLLSETNALPVMRQAFDYGWSVRLKEFYFRGYLSPLTPPFEEVMEAMRRALDKAFNASLLASAHKLDELVVNDLEAFQTRFIPSHGGTTFANTPILHHLNTDQFANTILRTVRAGQTDQIGDVILTLQDRYNSTQNWELEFKWAEVVRTKLLAGAEAEDGAFLALTHFFLTSYWTFPAPTQDNS